MELKYGVISLTGDYMVIQKGAQIRCTEIEESWTGKEIEIVKAEIESKPLWGIEWDAKIQGDKIICHGRK